MSKILFNHRLSVGVTDKMNDLLEEIAITGRDIFERSGGKKFRYIPALNDRTDHISALARIAINHLGTWVSQSPSNSCNDSQRITQKIP